MWSRAPAARLGAVVVKDGLILAEAANAVTASNDPTAHAEVGAIRAACKTLQCFDLHGCELYTSCEPCPMCLAAIYWARIDAVYYAATKEDASRAGFDDSLIYREFTLPVDERLIPMRHVNTPMAAQPMETWLKASSKVTY